MLKLVGSARFRPLRNVWMLEELGVKYVHDPARPRSDAARAINPFGKVPTLVDGDVVLYESAAINTYLSDKLRGAEGVPVLVPPAGTALLWGGTLVHAGAEVTEGRRLVFVASFTPGLVDA